VPAHPEGRLRRAAPAAIMPVIHGARSTPGEERAAAYQARAHAHRCTRVATRVLSAADDFEVGRAVVRSLPVAMVHVQAEQVAQLKEMPGHQPVEPHLDLPAFHRERDADVARVVPMAGESTPRGARLGASRSRSFF
jgi:hypothetical protein